jgi:hypothetical protein
VDSLATVKAAPGSGHETNMRRNYNKTVRCFELYMRSGAYGRDRAAGRLPPSDRLLTAAEVDQLNALPESEQPEYCKIKLYDSSQLIGANSTAASGVTTDAGGVANGEGAAPVPAPADSATESDRSPMQRGRSDAHTASERAHAHAHASSAGVAQTGAAGAAATVASASGTAAASAHTARSGAENGGVTAAPAASSKAAPAAAQRRPPGMPSTGSAPQVAAPQRRGAVGAAAPAAAGLTCGPPMPAAEASTAAAVLGTAQGTTAPAASMPLPVAGTAAAAESAASATVAGGKRPRPAQAAAQQAAPSAEAPAKKARPAGVGEAAGAAPSADGQHVRWTTRGPQPEPPSHDPQELVGRHVWRLWESHGWYKAAVEHYNPAELTHTIVFNKGSQHAVTERMPLLKPPVPLSWVDPNQKVAVRSSAQAASPAAPAAAPPQDRSGAAQREAATSQAAMHDEGDGDADGNMRRSARRGRGVHMTRESAYIHE